MAYGKRHKTTGNGRRRYLRGRWSRDKIGTRKQRRHEDKKESSQ